MRLRKGKNSILIRHRDVYAIYLVKILVTRKDGPVKSYWQYIAPTEQNMIGFYYKTEPDMPTRFMSRKQNHGAIRLEFDCFADKHYELEVTILERRVL